MELIDEKVSFKVDASGRVVIPASLRKKYEITIGDKLRCYTIEIDGKPYIAFSKDSN